MSNREEEKEELVVDAAEKPDTLSPEKTFGYGPESDIGDLERVVGWYTQMKDGLVDLGANRKEGPGIWKGSGCGL